jgi:chromosome segregation ATPase
MSEPATPQGETQVVTDPKTNANPTVQTPAANPELEAARKRAEQAEMQANMLRNQLAAREKAEAESKARELEEQNQFKTLYDQEKARREAIEAAQAEAERKATLAEETNKLLSQYPDAVKSLAETTGLSLTDIDDASVEAYKAKLDKIKAQIPQAKVTANNPSSTTPTITELTGQDINTLMKDPKKFEEYLRKNSKGIASMLRATE